MASALINLPMQISPEYHQLKKKVSNLELQLTDSERSAHICACVSYVYVINNA